MNDAPDSGTPRLILASASPSRAAVMRQAGLPALSEPAQIDETEIKSGLEAEGAGAREIAETLAELKAQKISRRRPGAIVVGADQILECEEVWFDKPIDLDQAAAHLRSLSGKTHRLISAVCVVRDSVRLWHHIAEARLTMRPLSEDFIKDYLAAVGPAALTSVGAYQLEGLGAQLFTRVEGDYFTILGLPLLPLMDFLRHHGVIAT
ncbi:MAG: Maf family protein [Alphaproteobacteria bacterium]